MSRGAGFVQVRRLRTPDQFVAHLSSLGVELPFDPVVAAGPSGPLAQPLTWHGPAVGTKVAGNRFCVLPMEGWDGTTDGRPTDRVRRRWTRFGESGAKLIWGCEAVAVDPDGRANPNQLVIDERTVEDLAAARVGLVQAHERCHGRTNDLVVGLQLTHSGRFSCPCGQPAPLVAYHHPLLDRRFPGGVTVATDDDLDRLATRFVTAARLAREAGFDFVDVKACHGYLGHELLSAVDRPGRYGGSLERRAGLLRAVVDGMRSAVPRLGIGVRLSAYDTAPHSPGPDGRGESEHHGSEYRYAFGGDGTAAGVDLTETHELLDRLESWGVRLVCITAGSPYYSPHIQRPAYFPPSDGYLPPRDPLFEVANMIRATAEITHRHPNLTVVGSGYSYLQEWLPNVAQPAVATGMVDAVGLGRMMLSYPTLPADVLAGRRLDRQSICRTFSDCTTAPRSGLPSGCYPLDPAYKHSDARRVLVAIKRSSEAVTA